LDSRAETEGLRTENQSLRNVVQQTNQKLNALISIQMENADRGGDAVNEELRMLRSKTATLEAEIQVPSLQRQSPRQQRRHKHASFSSSHKSVQRGKARRAGVRRGSSVCAPFWSLATCSQRAAQPRSWLLAEHPRKQRQTIQGSSVLVLPAWALLVVHDTHIRRSLENILFARASGCMNVCRGSSRLRRECRAQANRLRIWVQGLRQSIPWKWLDFRLKKMTMSMRSRMGIMRYLVHIQSMRATGIESFPELTPAGSK
jgi:hypothetical protein